MQGYAKANQIIVGQNVKEEAANDLSLYEVVDEKRYIFEIPHKNFHYTQYVFDWLKHLKSLNYVVTSPLGKLSLKSIVPLNFSNENISALREVASVNKPYYEK